MNKQLHILALEVVERLRQKEATPIIYDLLDKITENAEEWPIHKTFMRIGYVQGLMVAGGVDVAEIRQMVADSYSVHHAYCDLLDHNDPTSPFYLEIGGEG